VAVFSLAPDKKLNLFDQTNLRSDIDHFVGDIRSLDSVYARVSSLQPDMIFHLAAQSLVRESYRDPHTTWETNVQGTVNVLEAVRRWNRPCAVLIVTTDKVYENRDSLQGYCETDRLGGHDAYSASKAAAELAASSYQSSFFAESQVSLATARAGNVIGGGDWAQDRLMPDLMTAFGQGLVANIRNPDAVRPWQHVLDPLFGYLTLMAQLSGRSPSAIGSFNFGPDSEGGRTVAQLAALSARFWGEKARFKIVVEADARHEADKLLLSNQKALAKLGWAPVWGVEQAVMETVGWYRSYLGGKDAKDLCLGQIEAFERSHSHEVF
jgi:CDP-glucose 4,6-dehydratase